MNIHPKVVAASSVGPVVGAALVEFLARFDITIGGAELALFIGLVGLASGYWQASRPTVAKSEG